ncbi:MAG: glycosyltransferase family 2 protein [Lacunisphaera sp.]|nr:glycosyltransferase family 2 protein [Lacunisphaera sp.]
MNTTPAVPPRDDEPVPPGVVEALDLTMFVPCYNEEARITGTLETIKAAMAEVPCTYEVIVVDDGSNDRTAAVIEEFCRTNPDMPVRLHKNQRNLGLSRSFVDTAFRSRGRYYRLVCGDNVEPRGSMVKILRAIGSADIIIPYYPVLPGKSGVRKFISRLYTTLVDLLGGYRINYYNGCALYRRFHVMRWASYNYGFGFQAHLITTLLDEGATYTQVPLEGFHLTKDRGSPLNLRNFLSTGHTLIEIFIRRLRRTFYGN